jgi:hypothetical protein
VSIIQNVTPVRRFRKRGLKSIAAPDSPVALIHLPPRSPCHPRRLCRLRRLCRPRRVRAAPILLPPVAPICASRPALLCRRSAPTCAARTPPRRGIRSSTSPSVPTPPKHRLGLGFAWVDGASAAAVGPAAVGLGDLPELCAAEVLLRLACTFRLCATEVCCGREEGELISSPLACTFRSNAEI